MLQLLVELKAKIFSFRSEVFQLSSRHCRFSSHHHSQKNCFQKNLAIKFPFRDFFISHSGCKLFHLLLCYKKGTFDICTLFVAIICVIFCQLLDLGFTFRAQTKRYFLSFFVGSSIDGVVFDVKVSKLGERVLFSFLFLSFPQFNTVLPIIRVANQFQS